MKKSKKCIYSSRMKKNFSIKMKRRRIHKKISTLQYSIKNISQIYSPHNTTQYLIENCSSPFYFDEDDEQSLELELNLNPMTKDEADSFCSSILDLKNEHSDYALPSTAAQSQEIYNHKLSI